MCSSTSKQATFDKRGYHQQVSKLWTPGVRQFYRLVSSQLLFNTLFCAIFVIQIGLFFAFYAFFQQSTLVAFILALFFLTLFSYFILRIYRQAKKPEQLMEICTDYLKRCKEVFRYQEGVPEHQIALAHAAQQFASGLHEREYQFFQSYPLLKSFSAPLEKISCFFLWKDLHRLKEILLTQSVEEHLKVVKCEPTNLEVHAALANAYVMLSSLYADPRKYPGYDDERWIPPLRFSEEMQLKFRQTARKAIEEFKILHDYAPEDPWVHVQLAYSYHDLQMPEEEIQEYEIVLKLRPDDKETLFKLGMLYFQQGMNAKGLRIYEALQKTHYKKAESLIKFYGTFEES